MQLRTTVWTIAFAIATLGCAVAAVAAAHQPIGKSVLAHRDDSVVYLAPRQIGSCKLNQVVTGQVVALPGEIVRAGATKLRVGKQLFAKLIVNNQVVTTIPLVGAQTFSRTVVPAHELFILGNGQTKACDSRTVGAVPASSVVGYTQAGMAARVSAVQTQLDNRISAEKYVAAVYFLFVAYFLGYLFIHTAKLGRLRRELATLLNLIGSTEQEIDAG